MSLAPPLLIALELEGRPVIVFGQSGEAARRCKTLLEHGARVTVVAEVLSPELAELHAQNPELTLHLREPEPEDLHGQWLVVLADRNPAWLQKLGPAAEVAHIPFCAVDQPGFNSFSHVGVAKAGPLQLGISTAGRAPGLAAVFKRELQKLLDRSNVEELVAKVVRLRESSAPAERSDRVRQYVQAIQIDGLIRALDGPNLGESGPAESGPAESGPAESGPAESGLAELSSGELQKPRDP